MKRPLIGISGSVRVLEGAERAGVNAAYIHSIAKAGGIPILLTPPIGPEGAGPALEPLDGLVLTGGHDVDPQVYDAQPSPALGPVDPHRDEFELALFHAAPRSQSADPGHLSGTSAGQRGDGGYALPGLALGAAG